MKTKPENDDPPSRCSLIGLLIIVLIITIAACSMSCVSRFYERGQLTAEIRGDYTYHRTAAGAVSVTLKHSPVIRASGVATSQAVAAAGTAASVAILAAP